MCIDFTLFTAFICTLAWIYEDQKETGYSGNYRRMYGRKKEIEILKAIKQQSSEEAFVLGNMGNTWYIWYT